MENLFKSLDTKAALFTEVDPTILLATLFQSSIFSLCLNFFTIGDFVVLDNYPKLNCEKMRREAREVNKRLVSFYEEESRDRKKLKKEEYLKKYSTKNLADKFSYIIHGGDMKNSQFANVITGRVFLKD